MFGTLYSESRWRNVTVGAAERQRRLEESRDLHVTFQSVHMQLSQWLAEKKLMIGVLGPLALDPNMLSSQRQQVQFLQKEFQTRKMQVEQLTCIAHEISSGGSPVDQKHNDNNNFSTPIEDQLSDVTAAWHDSSQKLTERADHIDAVLNTSQTFSSTLEKISDETHNLAKRLQQVSGARGAAQAEAVSQRLAEAQEVLDGVTAMTVQLVDAEQLCKRLSVLLQEQYLQQEVHRRFEVTQKPWQQLQESAVKHVEQLQMTLTTSCQFSHSMMQLKGWLKACREEQKKLPPISTDLDILAQELEKQEQIQDQLKGREDEFQATLSEGTALLKSLQQRPEEQAVGRQMEDLKSQWEEVSEKVSSRRKVLHHCLKKSEKLKEMTEVISHYVKELEVGLNQECVATLKKEQLEVQLKGTRAIQDKTNQIEELLEELNTAADDLCDSCEVGVESVTEMKTILSHKIRNVVSQSQTRVKKIEIIYEKLKEFESKAVTIEEKLRKTTRILERHSSHEFASFLEDKNLEKMRACCAELDVLEKEASVLQVTAKQLAEESGDSTGGSRLVEQARSLAKEVLEAHVTAQKACSVMESQIQGLDRARCLMKQLLTEQADLGEELDAVGALSRGLPELKLRLEALNELIHKAEELGTRADEASNDFEQLRSALPVTGSEAVGMEREVKMVQRRHSRLFERICCAREETQTTLNRVDEFHRKVDEVSRLLNDAEKEGLSQDAVGTEIEVINQQLQQLQAFQKGKVEALQTAVQAVNWQGQALVQSAPPTADTHNLETSLEDVNTRWNSLNRQVAERAAKLQEALLHCGKFYEALESLLSWLADTEELVAGQKPPSAEYKVVRAQLQEQKLLQRVLEGNRVRVEALRSEGELIAEQTSEPVERQRVLGALESLDHRWQALIDKADARRRQLEAILTLAKQFHDTLQPLSDWMVGLERRLAMVEPVDTRSPVIQEQIKQLKALQEEITSRKPDVDQAVKKGQALLKQSTGDDTLLVQEKLEGLRAQYVELVATSNHATRSLEEALQLATHFEAAHGELDDALGSLEAGLYDYDEAEACGVEPTSLLQNRQQALRQGVMDGHVLLDTVNEVGRALLQLVPWRARERLDQQMAEAGERFRAVRYAVEQRAERVDAAIQRSQQFEQAVLAERAWAAEMSRKLDTLGEISLEQDQMSSQLRVQKAFTLDVLRHKETMEELVVNAPNVLASCNDEEKDRQQSQLEVLNQEFDSVNRSNSERQQRLERAQGLLGQFWESYEELCPWLDETETTLAILPAPAMEPDALRLQQDELRLLRESVAEHKPHIDRLAKTGPMLAELSAREGLVLADQATNVRQRYMAFRTEMQHRAIALDEAEELATQFHDKINPMIESLERVVERLREPPPTPAEVEKIRDQILETCAVTAELEKLQPSFMALRSRGEEIVARSEHTTSSDNSAARAVQKCLDHLAFLWSDIEARAEEREAHLLDVLDVAERFWPDLTALLTTLRDTFDCIRDLDEPGLDPSVIKQQTEVTQSFREEIDTLLDELETLRATGGDLMSACGEPDKPDVKKSIDEVNVLWDLLNKAWQDRMEHLEEAMQTTIQFQDMLQNIFDWLDSSEAQLVAMSPVGTELNTVKEQMVELKAFKEETYQQQIEMEKLSHQGEVLHRKAEGTANRDMLEAPLRELRRQWAVLDSKIITRQHKLESSLLALGQFQHALEELLSWLSHTEDLLAEQKPIREDPKEIEIELAKHHVLRNDVLAHKATLENVAQAGGELVQLGDGDVAGSVLRQKLNRLQKRWEDLLKETELRQKKLESALNQAQGFQGEIHALLAWLGKVEAQLLLSRPFGGLPETSRDQLNAHLELCADLDKREPTYLSLMERGVDVLSAGKTSSSTNTAQVLHSLEQRWQNVCAKAAERRVRNVRLAFVSFCVSEWYCCYNRTVG
uniref:Dystonin n=1 Tax=Eptatretus burgeri TaxID=7764 RepID=A0A8C4R7K7_EPTBU